MKRIAAIVLIFSILFSSAVMVSATEPLDEAYYRTNDYMQAVYDAYEFGYTTPYSSWVSYYECENRFAYVVADAIFDGHTNLAKKYITLASTITSDQDLLKLGRADVPIEVQYYEIALISLIRTMEQNLLDIEVQNAADQTMKPVDYVTEAISAAAGALGTVTGSEVVEGLITLLGATDAAISISEDALSVIESDEDMAIIKKMLVTYISVEYLLSAIEDYRCPNDYETMGYLKQAARNLRKSMKLSLWVNVSNFSEYCGKSTDEMYSFIFSDLLDALLKDDMSSVYPAFTADDMLALGLLNNAAKVLGIFSASRDVALFICDCTIGASDIVLRYHEIRAMAAARNAALYQAQSLHANINGIEDTAMIQEFGQYLQCLIHINARGEYCFYSLREKDMKLLTLCVNGKELDDWYEQITAMNYNEYVQMLRLYPDTMLYLRDLDDELGNAGLEDYKAVLENISDRIGYQDFSNAQKQHCMGSFFSLNGKTALIILYRVNDHQNLENGYYVELWGYKTDQGICQLASYLLDVSKDAAAYAYAAIRGQNENYYLDTYVRNQDSKKDTSNRRVFLIGQGLKETYWLYSQEGYFKDKDGMLYPNPGDSEFKINGDSVNETSFYSRNDDLNSVPIIIFVSPDDYEGYLMEELLDQARSLKLENPSKAGVFTEAYLLALQNHPEAHSYQLPVNGVKKTFTTPTEYTLYDIDKNDIPELIIREKNTHYYIYTFDGKTAVLCSGDNYWSYNECLRIFDGNGLVVHDGGMGSMSLEYVSLYELNGNSLDSAGLLYNGELESQEKLEECLDRYTPINDFYPITDHSLLES